MPLPQAPPFVLASDLRHQRLRPAKSFKLTSAAGCLFCRLNHRALPSACALDQRFVAILRTGASGSPAVPLVRLCFPVELPACAFARLVPPRLTSELPTSRLPFSSGAVSGISFGSRLRFLRRPILQIKFPTAPTAASPFFPSDQLSACASINPPVFPSNLSVRLTAWSSVAEDFRSDRSVHASANPVSSVHSKTRIHKSITNPNLINAAAAQKNLSSAPGNVQSPENSARRLKFLHRAGEMRFGFILH
jgi:hypothetical protein